MIPPAVLQQIFLNDYDCVAFPNFGLTRINTQGEEFRDIAVLDSAQAPDWNEAGIVYQSKAGLEVTQDTPDGERARCNGAIGIGTRIGRRTAGRLSTESKEGPHWEIFRVNPDGSGQVALTRPVTTLVLINCPATWPPPSARTTHRLPEQSPGGQRSRRVAPVGDGRRWQQSAPAAARHGD